MADFQDKNNVAQAAYVTGMRDQPSVPILWKWLAEGKIFEAGFGCEEVDDEENTTTALAETTPQYILQAPASTNLFVIPIMLKLSWSTDGGGINNWNYVFIKPAGLVATTFAITSPASLPYVGCMKLTNPAQSAPQAGAYYADPITVSALVAGDSVAYEYGTANDAFTTVGLVPPDAGCVRTTNFLAEGSPRIMTSGAAMLVYTISGTSDAVVAAYMQWAEVTEDDLN